MPRAFSSSRRVLASRTAMSFTLTKLLPRAGRQLLGWLLPAPAGHVPNLAAPQLMLFFLWSGLSIQGNCCLSTPKAPMCKPSARNSAKSVFAWPKPLYVSARTRTVVKPPQGRGPLSGPEQYHLTWQHCSWRKQEVKWKCGSWGDQGVVCCFAREYPGMKPLLHYRSQQTWLYVGRSPDIHSRDLFASPATHPSVIPGCHPPRGQTAIISQEKWTQDALRILEGLCMDSKEILIYALSPCKYVFTRHRSYLGCSCTTASHKWWLSSSRVDWKLG